MCFEIILLLGILVLRQWEGLLAKWVILVIYFMMYNMTFEG